MDPRGERGVVVLVAGTRGSHVVDSTEASHGRAHKTIRTATRRRSVRHQVTKSSNDQSRESGNRRFGPTTSTITRLSAHKAGGVMILFGRCQPKVCGVLMLSGSARLAGSPSSGAARWRPRPGVQGRSTGVWTVQLTKQRCDGRSGTSVRWSEGHDGARMVNNKNSLEGRW